jgi:methylated-DNA-[protein]-cysteine S-methyltransferase
LLLHWHCCKKKWEKGNKMSENFSSGFETPWGIGRVFSTNQLVYKVVLPGGEQSGALPDASLLTNVTAERLRRYYAGERVCFHDIPVDLSGISPFHLKALFSIRQIPYGEVRSYGQIAAACDSPRAARAVGAAMALNPLPIIFPCHRVVSTDGRLTGFSGAGGVQAKFRLLQMERIEFKGLRVVGLTSVLNTSNS